LEALKELAAEIGECALDHYGLTDLAARGASWLGAVPIDKRSRGMPVMQGVTRSASTNTNALNYYGHKLFGPVKLPGGVGRAAKAVTGSKSLVTVAGRLNVVLAVGFVVYDAASIAMCVAN
jgi:hypothetical protein